MNKEKQRVVIAWCLGLGFLGLIGSLGVFGTFNPFDFGDDVPKTPSPEGIALRGAIQRNDLASVKQHLAGGFEPDGEIGPVKENGDDLNPIALAASLGETEIVRELLHHGAGPSYGGGNCPQTPLGYATTHDSFEIMRMLIHSGAPINDNEQGSSSLAFAAMNGHAKSVRFLLDRGANPSGQVFQESDYKPLLQVVKEGKKYPEIVAMLENQIQLNARKGLKK